MITWIICRNVIIWASRLTWFKPLRCRETLKVRHYCPGRGLNRSGRVFRIIYCVSNFFFQPKKCSRSMGARPGKSWGNTARTWRPWGFTKIFWRTNPVRTILFFIFIADGNHFCFFFFYTSAGVYHHVTGDYLGMLSVRMIGWGLYGSDAYWLLANSWGTSWGEKGFFKIRRFDNECWIENFRYAGDPAL